MQIGPSDQQAGAETYPRSQIQVSVRKNIYQKRRFENMEYNLFEIGKMKLCIRVSKDLSWIPRFFVKVQ